MLFKPFLFGLFLLQLARSFGRLSLFGGKKSRNKNCKTDEFEKYNVPANSSAKCIDGSSPSFYFRQGKDNGVSKWFVYFEGGGWCYDMKACEIRSKIHYGSSLEYPRCEKVDKANIFLTSDQKKNPQFYNWNMVHVKYCDGSSYAGDRDVVHNGKTFFFRGKHNREQTILSLLSLGMKSAKEIVISGCSAGGLAIYLGLDQMVHQIKEVNPSASVRGVSFSGFFLDYSSTKPQVEGNKDDGVWNGYLDYANSMKNLYQWMNIRSGANPRCVSSQLQRHRNDTDCIFAYYLAAHIKTPIFNIQPKYDHWQAMHILGSKDNVAINSYGHTLQKQMIETFHHSALADKHGTFIDSCNHHCFGCSVAEEDTWNGPHVVSTGDKLTPAAALRRWYEASLEREKSLEEKTHQHRYFQDFPFPCESCCKCSW